MASRERVTEPIGVRLAEALKALRERRRFNQPQLAARLTDLGVPMHATAVSKIEQRERRVDVDDLVALALALGTSPNRLLLTPNADESQVGLTSVLEVSTAEAWRWARGIKPLERDLGEAAAQGEEARVLRWQEFVRENSPRGADVGDFQFDPVLFGTVGDRQAVVQSVLGTLMWALRTGLRPDALHQLVDTAVATVNGHEDAG